MRRGCRIPALLVILALLPGASLAASTRGQAVAASDAPRHARAEPGFTASRGQGPTAQDPSPDRWEGADLTALRTHYLEAVGDPRAIRRGLAEIARLRAEEPVPAGSRLDGTLTAYSGALITLRAKHVFLPTTRLRHLREGLAILDVVVERAPDHVEARYLRLISCFYLPPILGRRGSVREDLTELARSLADLPDPHSQTVYSTIADFLLTEGDLPPDLRRPLERNFGRADG